MLVAPTRLSCHHHFAQFEHQIILQTCWIFHLKMTWQYFNCSINGFLFANDQHLINVIQTALSSSRYNMHGSGSLSCKTSFLHLVYYFLPKLSCSLNQSINYLLQNLTVFFVYTFTYHFIIPFWNLHINLMLQISIQKGIVNVY